MDAMLNNERLSLYSIPAMYVLSLVPAVLKNRLVGSQAGWDKCVPLLLFTTLYALLHSL